MDKERLDVLMVNHGLVDSRAQAQRLVMAGQVRVDGQVYLKPSTGIPTGSLIEIDKGPPFVSRGGEKLGAALSAFDILVEDRVCADVGASTGGFTDNLLQHGARRVYAIDVGHGILHWKLRQDHRVVVMERTNARFVERLPEPVQLVTVDASFISLKLLLPVITGWFAGVESPGPVQPLPGQVVALIKPQFEAGRQSVARGHGVVRDPAVHRQVLVDVLGFAQSEGFAARGLLRSPLLGPKGNAEFLAWLDYPGTGRLDLDALVAQTVEG